MDRAVEQSTTCVAGVRARLRLAEIDWRLAECLSLVEDLRLRSVASETPGAEARLVNAERQLESMVRVREQLSESSVEDQSRSSRNVVFQ